MGSSARHYGLHFARSPLVCTSSIQDEFLPLSGSRPDDKQATRAYVLSPLVALPPSTGLDHEVHALPALHPQLGTVSPPVQRNVSPHIAVEQRNALDVHSNRRPLKHRSVDLAEDVSKNKNPVIRQVDVLQAFQYVSGESWTLSVNSYKRERTVLY